MSFNAFEGGGFDSHSGGYGADSGGSQGTRAQSRQTVTPVTIKQILTGERQNPDAELVIDGVEVSMVSFVGIIRNVIDNTTSFVYRIEDGTSSIDCKKFVDDADSIMEDGETVNPSEKISLKEGDYVSVVGTLRQYGGRTGIAYPVIHKISDYNQVVYHLLNAALNHFKLTRPSKGASGTFGATTHTGGGDLIDSSGLDGAQQKIYRAVSDIYQQTGNSEGVHVNQLSRSTGIPLESVQALCEALQEKGVIYSGFDDDHFLPSL